MHVLQVPCHFIESSKHTALVRSSLALTYDFTEFPGDWSTARHREKPPSEAELLHQRAYRRQALHLGEVFVRAVFGRVQLRRSAETLFSRH